MSSPRARGRRYRAATRRGIGLFLALGLLGAPALAEIPEGASPAHDAVPMAFAMRTTADGSLHASLRMFGRRFLLRLEPNALFTPGATTLWIDGVGAREERPAATFYRGTVAGDRHSRVRLAVRGQALEGIVWTASETYFLVPAASGRADTVAYRRSDAPSPGACAGEMASGVCPAASIDVVLVADGAYFEAHGASSALDMQSAINQLDGLYEAATGGALRISRTLIFAAPADPFGDTADAGGLLDEAERYRTTIGECDGLLHLFTGRDLAGAAAGAARAGPACGSGVSLSLSAGTGERTELLAAADQIARALGAAPRLGCAAPATGRARRAGTVPAAPAAGEPALRSLAAAAVPARVTAPAMPESAAPLPDPAPAAATGQAGVVNSQALAALGQENLVYNILNQTTASSLFFPTDIALDPSVSQTRFYVADALNSRVLGYECSGAACPLATAAAAVRVFGQPDFSHWQSNGGVGSAVSGANLSFPHGVAAGASGALYVADTSNNRVLVYQNAWNDWTPDAVLGQTSLSASTPGAGLDQLRAPEGVFVDSSGVLWVADTGNHRVLKFTNTGTGASAAFAIGGSGAPAATTLSAPRDVFVDAPGALWVADTGYSRVLRYAPPLTAGKAASTVFGHAGSMANGTANQGGLDAASLAFPEKLHVDGAGRLWVADTGNRRVLEYDTPLTSQTASRVFGQVDRNAVPTFASNAIDAPDGFPNAAGMGGPRGIAFDATGEMWVCDRDDSRILAFASPLGAAPDAITADRVLGKPSFVDSSVNLASERRMNNPTGVAVDRSHSPNRLWVVDVGNNRVLGYDSTANVTDDRAADIVLGQPSFAQGPTNAGLNGPLQNAANATASAQSLFYPEGIASDSQGGVYVADSSNNRVLFFSDPFATDKVADRVFGQSGFTTLNPKFPYGTASSLTGPQGVYVDAADDLWVADTVNHRVVRFSDAPSQPEAGGSADLVLGQSGFVSSNTFPPYAPGCAANRMNLPRGVFVAASGRVYVADSGNHRVLVFNPPLSSGMNASAVFGQAGFGACNPDRGGATGAATLDDPRGVYEDPAGDVFVADYENHRVLVYHTPFNGGDLVADEVIGQPDFSTTTITSPGPHTLVHPQAVTMDDAGNLFVADVENSRVTRYSTDPNPVVLLDPIASPVVIGAFTTFTGTGFTAGSVIKVFVSTPAGVKAFGPYTPYAWHPGYLIWQVDAGIPPGNGFATFMIVNTDQGYIQSNGQSQLLYGNPGLGMPTIRQIDGVDISPADPSIPLANVETVVTQGATVTLTGSGFDGALVNLFTASGNFGPLTPLAGSTADELRIVVPANTPTGPGSFQVVNSPYTGNVLSNAVSVPIGARVTISYIDQSGDTVTVTGTGFSSLTVINLFNRQGNGAPNLGGLNSEGDPKIPLTVVSSTQFTFAVPASAVSGPSYVQVLNPPFIPFSSSGNDPDGAFLLNAP
jgi:sugar lactone lactonase YvrE